MFAVQHGQPRGSAVEPTEKGNNQDENAAEKAAVEGNGHEGEEAANDQDIHSLSPSKKSQHDAGNGDNSANDSPSKLEEMDRAESQQAQGMQMESLHGLDI